ncbi:MAG: NAD-dependent epimerase/dehydratase family protein, partial [Chloroflexota bacterium]
MEPEGDMVFLTGASGFLGGHILRALLAEGFAVRALTRRGSRPLPALAGCTPIPGDLSRPGNLIRAMEGCRYLMHVAALYSFSPGRRRAIWATNVRGSAGLLATAGQAGIERAVVTSSSATVGPGSMDRPATEENWASDDDASPYHRSKIWQERAVLAARVPSILLLPTAPVGPGDWKPTPTGKMIVDFMRGRMFATLSGGLNLVPVEDVARAHVLALRHGRPHERYVLGGQNLEIGQIWRTLAAITGRKAPARRIPYGLAFSLGWLDDRRCRIM